jgi:AraC-like DNA-binding protein/TolB-like protein
MNKEFITKLTELVEANLANEHFGPEELAREMGMSHSSIHRRLKEISNQNISQFIREIRLKKAKELLLAEDLTASEIAYRVGFGSPTYFNKCFHSYYGYSPGEFRNREPEANPEVENVEIQLKSNKRQIKPVILLTTITVIIVLILLIRVYKPISGNQENIDKTIAVLPFVDYSKGKENTYIINGLREEICNNLEIIRDLKIKSRTDAEKYKDSGLSTQQIAKELKVNYLVTGSGQEVDNKIMFRFQLVEAATGNTIWWNALYTELTDIKTKKMFEILKDAAIDVVYSIKEVLIPNKNEWTSNLSEDSLETEKLYVRSVKLRDLASRLNFAEKADEALLKAKKLCEQTIKLDSTYAKAYAMLAAIYDWNLYNTPEIILSQSYLDSAFLMANKALQLDPRNHWALGIRADYYLKKGMTKEFDQAHKAFDNHIDTSNDLFEFWNSQKLLDSYHAIVSFLKMWERSASGSNVYGTNEPVIQCFSEMGYPEISKKLSKDVLNGTKDSLLYFYSLLEIEKLAGNFREAVKYGLIMAKMDSLDVPEGNLALLYLSLRDYSTAYKYLQMENNPFKLRNWIVPDITMGYLYSKNGNQKAAASFFNNAEKNCLLEIKYNRINAQNFYSQFYLACIYSSRGEKRKALENLKSLKKRETDPLWLVIDLKQSPFLDNIRQEPEFADVLKDVESKYQKVHLLVGQLVKKKVFLIHINRMTYYLPECFLTLFPCKTFKLLQPFDP